MSDGKAADLERFLAEHGPFEKAPIFKYGDRIDDWQVLAFLGRGATSEVYRAENVVTRQVGAVKVLARDGNRARGRFRRDRRRTRRRFAAFGRRAHLRRGGRPAVCAVRPDLL